MPDVKMLALDIATKFGWAVGSAESIPLFGSHQLPKPRYEGDFSARFLALAQWLHDAIDMHKPDMIVYEEPVMPRGVEMSTTWATTRLLIGLVSWADGVAEDRGLKAFEVNNSTWKKHFSGSGRAEKIDTIRRCFSLGLHPADDNAADAIGILSYALHMKGQPPAWDSGLPVAAPAGEIGPKAWPLSENAKLRKGTPK